MRLAEPARGKTRKGLKTGQDHRWKKNGSEIETKQKAPARIDCIQRGLSRTKSKTSNKSKTSAVVTFLA